MLNTSVAMADSVALTLVGAPAAAASHTVEQGDTVTRIAIKNGLQTRNVLAWNGLTPHTTIHPGQTLRLSAPASSAPAPRVAETGTDAVTHTVAAGETVWGIARQHGTSVASVIDANDLGASATIYPGQKLRIGGAPSPAPKPAASPSPATSSDSSAATHTVAAGDTLWAIAQAAGTNVATILEANDLAPGAIIYPGQTLKLSTPKPVTAENTQRFASLDTAQTENARLIIRVGRSVNAADRAIATALATAMVESSLRNIDHGDRDSLGLFQQRPSQGWGTPEQITDAERSTRVFFGGRQDPNGSATKGLYDIADWKSMSFGDAAQAVQISAYPDRYGQWETQAYRWLAELG